MLGKVVRVTALLVVFSGLFGMVAVSELPPDVPSGLADAMRAVVSRLSIGLTTGGFPFSSTPIELGPGVRTYLTTQQFRPEQALEAIEKGFPTQRFETDQAFPFWDQTIPAGHYYLILWLADRGFERFTIKFLPRTPLLLFVKEQGLELTEFGIACKVEVPVPNPNPDKVFPFTSTIPPKDCEKQTAATSSSASSQPLPTSKSSASSSWGVGITPYGLGDISVMVAMEDGEVWIWPIGCFVPLKLPMPSADELFPKQEEMPPPPPCDPC